MKHLIGPLQGSVKDVFEELNSEYKRISNLQLNFPHLEQRSAGWASDLKRVKVAVSESIQQPIFEIVNQMATVERMLECFEWILSSESRLASCWVDVCHPTTSSGDDDNDLVLFDKMGGTCVARFECSDVMGQKDSNGKSRRDIQSLMNASHSERERLFVVTSEELGDLIARRFDQAVRAVHSPDLKRTRVIEIIQGQMKDILESKTQKSRKAA